MQMHTQFQCSLQCKASRLLSGSSHLYRFMSISFGECQKSVQLVNDYWHKLTYKHHTYPKQPGKKANGMPLDRMPYIQML